MLSSQRLLIRYGMFTLPIAGLLFALGFTLRGPLSSSLRASSQSAFTYDFIWLTLMLASMFSLYGVVVLYEYLSTSRMKYSIVWALVFCLTAWAIELVLQGIFPLVGPGRVLQPASPFLLFFALEGLCGLVGGLLFAIAIWRSGMLPRWIALCYGPHILLLNVTGGVAFGAQLLGTLCLLIAGCWIVWYSWRS